MIIFQERNDEGRQRTAELFAEFCASQRQSSAIDRVSFLYGMQAFCCDQLKQELDSAVDALEHVGAKSIPQPASRRALRGPRQRQTT